jgi:ABC-type phosphate/phosphonate transport system substrate-binding protein
VVVRADSACRDLTDLKGERVAVGAVDSPQATLIPLAMLHSHGVATQAQDIVRFEVGVGLHGDHIGGERDAARALIAGDVAAACMLDANHLLFTREGTLSSGTHILATTAAYDHCNMTMVSGHADRELDHLRQLLLSMSYADPRLRPLMDMEGLTAWRPGRISGYRALSDAVDTVGLYGPSGEMTHPSYMP